MLADVYLEDLPHRSPTKYIKYMQKCNTKHRAPQRHWASQHLDFKDERLAPVTVQSSPFPPARRNWPGFAVADTLAVA